jgi:serine phosphatase RsbU (regulator of sigma subunit)
VLKDKKFKESKMAKTILTITGHGKTWQNEPNPKGTIIGRGSMCDIVIDSKEISREHARVFQDPFGRWIVEDIGSTNGIFINGKRIEACAVLPGEQVVMGSLLLTLTQPLDVQIKPDNSVHTTATITIDGFETELISGKSEPYETLSGPYLKRLSEIIESLSELTSSTTLYPEVCRCLAQLPETVAVVLRLPEKTKPIPKSPDILAYHFSGDELDTTTKDAARFPRLPLAFRLSTRVLEAIRATGNAVMVKAIYSSDEEVTWAFVDEQSPRAIICTPLGDVTEEVDCLYLDIPIDEAPQDSLEFVRAIARQVISARKRLLFMQAKTERGILDYQLSFAQKIQSRLVPTIQQTLYGVDIALYHKPTIWVGGNYCDVWSLKDGRLALAVGDISSKGLPAAMIMSDLRVALRTTMSFCNNPSSSIEQVNSHLVQTLPKGVFVSLFLGLFDPQKGTLEYVNAGHLQPLIVRPKSMGVPLGQPDNPVLGTADASFQIDVETIPLNACLLVFTDGITEAMSPKGSEFGVKGVISLLKTIGDLSAKRAINLVIESLENFRQSCAQQDDITVLALVNRPPDSK